MIDFPPPTGIGQAFTAPNGTVWIWDGVKWTGTGNPWTSVRYRNRIINGDMSVDQRNGGALVATVGTSMYAIDRWKFITNISAAKGSVGQNTGATASGLPYSQSLVWYTGTAYAVAAADYFAFIEQVEGYNFNDALWGTANAQPVTLEFWANSTIAGTYSGAVRNGASNRSYVFSYVLPAGGWVKFRVPIPGDTAGTWSVAGNAMALQLSFSIGTGATNSTAAGSWQAGNFLAAPGTVNIVGTVANQLNITGVALMVGAAASNAEPELKSFADNLIDCKRYFQRLGGSTAYDLMIEGTAATGTASWQVASSLAITSMRAAPSAAPVGTAWNQVNVTTSSIFPGANTVALQITATGAGTFLWGTAAGSSIILDADF